MDSKNVVVFLNTPLYRFTYGQDNEERQLIENAVHVEGKVVKESAGGVTMRVSTVSSRREAQEELPFSTLFIPFHKIDFMIVV